MNEMVKSLARAMRGLTQWLVPNACSSLDAPVASGWRQKLTRYALRSVLLSFATIATPALAVLDGPTMWTQFKGLIFGPWGLVIGVCIAFAGLFGIPRWGVMGAVGIIAVAVVFFCIPGMMGVLQTSAQAIS